MLCYNFINMLCNGSLIRESMCSHVNASYELPRTCVRVWQVRRMREVLTHEDASGTSISRVVTSGRLSASKDKGFRGPTRTTFGSGLSRLRGTRSTNNDHSFDLAAKRRTPKSMYQSCIHTYTLWTHWYTSKFVNINVYTRLTYVLHVYTFKRIFATNVFYLFNANDLKNSSLRGECERCVSTVIHNTQTFDYMA